MSHNKSQTATARNKARLMELLQDPSNKHCADCKTSRNPRWASWNLGIFICIRCSGIHRSLGTHITRVKSVDLDSWTDEQTESMSLWGNKRGNSYWEAKLKPRNEKELEMGGYIPMDGKVESFVRTKYELGKWKDDGPRDPTRYSNSAKSKAQQSSISVTTPVSNSKTSDSLDSLLDFGPPKNTPVVLSSSSSSSLPSASNRGTNSTVSLLQQQQKQQQQQPHQPQQQPSQQQRNHRPDLKKSILSLYSTPSPSASYSNVSLAGSNTMSTSTINSAYTPQQSANAPASTVWASATPTSTNQTKNYVGDDPFKNVWS